MVDGAEGGSGKCVGGAREELCGQRERAENVSGVHTLYATEAGFFETVVVDGYSTPGTGSWARLKRV